MADNTLLPPQPDFGQIGHAMQHFQSEIMKFQNIPAISQGNEILHAINQLSTDLRNEVAGLRNHVANEVAGLRNHVANEVAGLRNEVASLRLGLTAR
jgi:phage host-nuclease inhibitor protein Gam